MDERPMRVLVCGGRDFSDRVRLFNALDRIHRKRGVAVIIDGAARGADSLGARWAIERGVASERHPADWARFGKSAGYRRNEAMLDEGAPDLVVAFPGGRGTAHMVELARSKGFVVWQP